MKKKIAHVPGVDTGYFRHRYTNFRHTNLGTFLTTDVYFFSVLNPVYSFNSSDLCQVLNIKEEAVFFLCLSRIARVSLGQFLTPINILLSSYLQQFYYKKHTQNKILLSWIDFFNQWKITKFIDLKLYFTRQ